MSRRRPSVMHMQVVLDVECPKKHRVGFVTKLLDPHPDAGTYQVSLPLRFEEPPIPGDDTGRIRGTCPTCAADVQIAWSRAKSTLDDHAEHGRHTGRLR